MAKAKVKCKDCQFKDDDVFPSGTSLYFFAACWHDIVTPVIVDANVERECEHFKKAEAVEDRYSPLGAKNLRGFGKP